MVAGPGACKEELALGLSLHLYIWVFSGHRIIVNCVVPTLVPRGSEWARGIPQTPCVGGEGHVDTQTLLHPHQFLHLELIAWLLLQGPWGGHRNSALAPAAPPPAHPPSCDNSPPTARAAAAGALHLLLPGQSRSREMPSCGVELRMPQQEAVGDRAVAGPGGELGLHRPWVVGGG